jgi:hypothetical protein
MRRITAFTWGYWGWGTHAREFVKNVDAVERSRGCRPPIFVDIRFSRKVRAPNFKDNEFEKMIGPSRYRWRRRLGNERIESRRGGIRIHDLTGIDDLLQIIGDAANYRRRVIFFAPAKIRPRAIAPTWHELC